MTLCALLSLLLCTPPLFSVQAIPLSHRDAQVFVAMAHDDGVADLFVLDHRQLLIYENGGRPTRNRPPPSPRASAPSIFATPTATASARSSTFTTPKSSDAISPQMLPPIQKCSSNNKACSQTPPEPLSPMSSLFAATNAPSLLSPCHSSFELRNMQGELIASHPLASHTAPDAPFGKPFSLWPLNPPQSGPPHALEFRVSKMDAYQPDLPQDLSPLPLSPPSLRRGTPRQLREAALQQSSAWPWFPLQADPERPTRILYALSQEKRLETLIRTQHFDTNREIISPPRHYPGALLLTDDALPDFNHDGYHDLVLWNSPEPAPTLNTLTKLLTRNTWPLRISVHLFNPLKKRYEAAPASYCSLQAPLLWFISAAYETPLRNVVLRDFNGDGATDIGCSTRPDTYSIWLWRENGLPPNPDFQHQFLTPLQKVDLIAELAGKAGGSSLVLRGDKVLFLLRTAPKNLDAS